MASWLTKKAFSPIEVMVLAAASFGGLSLVLWFVHFKDLDRFYELPRLAGESSAEFKRRYGEPYRVESGEQYNRIVGGEQGSLNPAPVPQADIEEVWYYYVGNNHYALLYLKDDKVVRIHLSAT